MGRYSRFTLQCTPVFTLKPNTYNKDSPHVEETGSATWVSEKSAPSKNPTSAGTPCPSRPKQACLLWGRYIKIYPTTAKLTAAFRRQPRSECPCKLTPTWQRTPRFTGTYITYVLLVALTPPIGILLTITEEFFGIRALSSVYSENNRNTEKTWVNL